MYSPLRNGQSSHAQRLVPSGYMLVDAIYERPIQVENNPRCFHDFSKQKNGDRCARPPRIDETN
jgi:hypothetical protein